MTTALVAARGRPAVLTFQLLPESGRAWSPDELFHQRSDRIVALAARVARRVRYVAVSRQDETRLRRLLPAHRLVRIGNAPPFARVASGAVVPFAWPDGHVRLLSAGRLHRQKGFDRLLSALADPTVRALPWFLLVAGEGPEAAALEARIDQLGLRDRVRIEGGLAAHALYPNADLVLSPSRWEGMPLVPMEAVECGVPVIVSPIEPHRELFAHSPESVLPEDEASWAPVLARWIGDRTARDTLRRAQRDVLPADPRQQMWNAYAALYRSLSGVASTP